MEGIAEEFLLTAIKEKMEEGQELHESVLQLLSSSLFKVTNYPLVVVEDDPFDFNQIADNTDDITGTKETFNIAVIIKTKNLNSFSDEEYIGYKKQLKTLSKKIIKIIIERAATYDCIVDVAFGKGERFDHKISTTPVMQMLIPCTVTVADF